VASVEIREVNAAYFVAKGRIGLGCDLYSPPERVPREGLSHLFGNWDPKFSAHEK
jgi:hypothetical protein